MPRAQHSLVFESFGLAAEVVSDDRELLELFSSGLLLGWRPRNGTSGKVRFEALRDGTITLDGDEVARTDGNLSATVAALDSAVRHHLALNAPAHVFVHAGVVGVGGAAIVIPGSSFSGKTTLVAALLDAGATYYSDEYAVVDADGMIHAYPNPLSLRFDPRSGGANVRVSVPDAQIGTEPVRARVIVVTSYEAGAVWRPAERTAGEGALALLEHTVAARSRPRPALAAARRLAQDARVIAGARGEAIPAAQALVEAALSST